MTDLSDIRAALEQQVQTFREETDRAVARIDAWFEIAPKLAELMSVLEMERTDARGRPGKPVEVVLTEPSRINQPPEVAMMLPTWPFVCGSTGRWQERPLFATRAVLRFRIALDGRVDAIYYPSQMNEHEGEKRPFDVISRHEPSVLLTDTLKEILRDFFERVDAHHWTKDISRYDPDIPTYVTSKAQIGFE